MERMLSFISCRKIKHEKLRTNSQAQTVLLVFIMLAAAVFAVWLAVSPALEKRRMLDHQVELLASIEQGDGVIVLDKIFTETMLDFYGEAVLEADVLSDNTHTAAPDLSDTLTGESVQIETIITGIGVLTIDRIGVRLPVTEGASAANLKVTVGHVPQTPEIGATGNAVIAGHRSYTYGQYFNRLGELSIGDIIQYQPKDSDVFKFEVYEILEVLPGDPAAFWQPENDSVLTLLTCTPVRTASHRLLVRARQI